MKLPAVAHFEAGDHFRFNNLAGVLISFASDAFIRNFLLLGSKGKKEISVPEVTVHIFQPPESMSKEEAALYLDNPRRVIALAHLWALLERQPEGESGFLQNNRAENVCLIDKCGAEEKGCCAAIAWFEAEGWAFDAVTLEDLKQRLKKGSRLIVPSTPLL
ncbi:hypothetical protein KW785_02865 [Candidatus Parcubacteria bacterium]|nr:hypothetical protein [Candidatus Parcubacteria bacterium]